jgi:tripartite ATP-independent transporter DctM subunit
LIITIYIQAKLNPEMGPGGPKASWLSRLATVKDVWAVLLLFIVVMGGIYGGVMTPTDAAAAGAFCAFIIALVRKRLTKKTLIVSLMNTIRTTGMIYILIIGAMLFGYFMALSGLSISLADIVTNLPLSPILILISILFLFLVLGCLMDAFAMLLIIVPILFPVIVRLGFEPLWFAVLTVIMMEMGFITPPIGMNVFVLKGVATEVPMGTIFRGILPFVVAIAVCVAFVVAFPQIALFLPSVMK